MKWERSRHLMRKTIREHKIQIITKSLKITKTFLKTILVLIGKKRGELIQLQKLPASLAIK